MSDYSIRPEGEKYVIYDGDAPLTTPMGNPVETRYIELAIRIKIDLIKMGYNFHSANSILAWHFTMIDNFSKMDHKQAEETLMQCFMCGAPDWTITNPCPDEEWKAFFGELNTRSDQIHAWLQKCTLMQLTAVCCIGNAYFSINLAFALAMVLEKFDSDSDKRSAALRTIARLIAENACFGSECEILEDFESFELYYGIHLRENGPILKGILDIDDLEDVELDEEEIVVDQLTGKSVTVEQLVGRNYYHYTDWELDKGQPASLLAVTELPLEQSDEEEDPEKKDEEADNLSGYLSDDCWVKRFVDDNDPNIFYLMYIHVNEDGEIEESDCIQETVEKASCGGFVFVTPGIEMSSDKSYDYCFDPPSKVLNDLRMLFKGKALPLDFTFKGKKLPQKMIDECGNGGSNTDYAFAIQSAQRLAYMAMNVFTTVDAVIEDFSYSTYQSSGSASGDLFSRPMCISDRRDEAVETLLYIYDMYSDEELSRFTD